MSLESDPFEVAKAFDNHPKMHGHANTVHVVNGNSTKSYGPSHMAIQPKGKTLILRRPKYRFEAGPGDSMPAKPKGDVYLERSMTVKPDKDTRRKLHRQISGGKKKGKVNGMTYQVAKAKKQEKASVGRHVTAQIFPGIHGAAVGKPGKKARAFGNETVGGMAGAWAGAAAGAALTRHPLGAAAGAGIGSTAGVAAGVHRNQKRGYYMKQAKRPVKKNDPFGIEKAVNPGKLRTLQSISSAKVTKVPRRAGADALKARLAGKYKGDEGAHALADTHTDLRPGATRVHVRPVKKNADPFGIEKRDGEKKYKLGPDAPALGAALVGTAGGTAVGHEAGMQLATRSAKGVRSAAKFVRRVDRGRTVGGTLGAAAGAAGGWYSAKAGEKHRAKKAA